jgi:hypothetical protein
MYSSYIYNFDTGISNKAKRRREIRSERRHTRPTFTTLTLVSQTRQEKEEKKSLKGDILILHLQLHWPSVHNMDELDKYTVHRTPLDYSV